MSLNLWSLPPCRSIAGDYRSRKAPHPKYFVGEGKAVEIAEAVKATGASVVLFDHALSPAQERNLERLCECRVIDRTALF